MKRYQHDTAVGQTRAFTPAEPFGRAGDGVQECLSAMAAPLRTGATVLSSGPCLGAAEGARPRERDRGARTKRAGLRGADRVAVRTTLCRRGFTLIELLVVIAIIALLVSILIPSLKRARAMAMTAVCQTRLRSLVTGLNFYAEEHSGIIPPGRHTGLIGPEWDCDPWGDWWWGMSGLWPIVENLDIFQCPADPYKPTNPRIQGRIGWPACGSGLDDWREGYSFGYNLWGMQDSNQWRPLERVPTDIIWLYGHSGGFVHPFVAGETGSAGHLTDYAAADMGLPVQSEDVPYYTAGDVNYVTKRHLNGFNAVRINGEVRRYEWGESLRQDWRE